MMHDSLIQFCEFLAPPFARAWLKKQLIDLKLYEERVKKLKDGVKNLKKARVVVEHRVDEEEKRYGREITNEVKEWIEAVRKIISEYEAFDEDEENHKLAVFDFFASGKLPKPGIRYSRSKEANVIIKKVDGLLQKAKHDTFSYWVDTPSMAAFFSNVDYISFPSRDETKKKIMAELEKPNVRMIGLHGFSGVGKTTLVKQVAEEVREGEIKIFDVVIVASVSRNADIRKIQGQIADMLGMKLDEESDIARAARIQKRLKNEKKSFLVVLDDLWAKLDLNMVGIPSENDSGGVLKNVKEGKSFVPLNVEKTELDVFNMTKSKNLPVDSNMMKTEGTPSGYKGCKVLLISETKQVLLSQMEGKGNPIFSLEVLNEEEAETLFKKKAGIDDTNSKFAKLAAQIAHRCEGLPMSIIATAGALRNQRPSVWEEVNRNLEQQKLTGAPEFSTKLSYDLLENEELKYTFLLCARMGQDALIMDLVNYCIGLDFLQGIYTVSEARDRVYALVGKLKESGLLSDGKSNDHFTMQNIVRGAALSIASKVIYVFTVTKGKLNEWPDKDKLKRYAIISLHHCDIIEGFPRNITCPRLRVFHVNNNDPNLKIPDDFFEEMKELKVLILTGFHLSPLPSSIARLTKLRMLCLEQCILNEKLPIIGELKKLTILSLSGSDIAKLPYELNQLTKLQIFDISNCSKLREIPSNIMRSLINLEELYMRNTLIEWKDEEMKSHCENVASLSELRHLNQLTTVDIQISNVAHLPKNLFFDKLYSYKIVIGDLKAYLETDFKIPEKYEKSRFLALHLKNGFDIHSQKGIKLLFKRVEILLLEDLNGVQDIFYRLNLKGFPYLKHLSIVSNSDIKSLIKPMDRQRSEKAFPKLESLYLYNLKNMNEICSCKLSAPSFGKLKAIKINLCGQLKNVFLIFVVRLLTDLETIEVSECNSLKEIFAVEKQCCTKEIEYLDFSELRSLTLQALPQFISFCPNSSKGREISGLFHKEAVFSKLERIELSSIKIDIIWNDHPSLSSYFRNLIHLDVNDCWNLKYLLSISTAKSLVNLQSLFVSECDRMSSLFLQGKGSNSKMEDNTEPKQGSILPNLKNMNLSSMKSLREIWNSELPSDSFGKLNTLILEQCDKLENVFPSNVEGKIFRSICNLTVSNCMSMKAIFNLGDKNRDAVDVTKLQDVHLEALPKLKRVWKWNKNQEGFLNLNNLQKILVYDCDSLKNIFPISMAKCLSNLEHLVLRNCLKLREIAAKGEGTNTHKGIPNPTIKFEFPKLSTIKLVNLPKLESFYPGVCELRCSALNDLSIERCDKLEPFRKENADEQSQSALFSEEIINKLKSMQIELEPFRKGTADEQSKPTLSNEEIVNKLKSMQIELEPFRKGTANEQSKSTLFNEEVINKLKSMQIKLEPFRKGTADEQSKPACFNEEVINKLKSMQIELELFRKGIADEQSKSALFSEEVIDKLKSMQIVLEPFRKGTADEQSKSALFNEEVINKLKSIEIVLEPFRKGTVYEQSKSALFNEEVINKLKCMQIESWHAKSSTSYMGEGNYRRDNLEDLHLSRLSDTEVLYSFLHRNPNLERLSLNNCLFKEIVPVINPSDIENMGVVPELKSLKLTVLPKLENIGFERDIILQRIEVLILEKCPCLDTIVPFSSISLTYLTNLEVVDCDGLKSLMPPSTAKSLIQLSTIKVINCKSLKEIISEQGNEENNRGKVDIVFRQLKVLELVSLNSLQSFCSSKSCVFVFPSLENVIVSACPKMKNFSEEVNSTPILKNIYVVQDKEKKRCYWDGNLNDTTQKIFVEKRYFEGMEEMSHSEYLELQQAAWHVGVGLQKNWFYSLKTLKLVKCELQRYAIPSHILPYLSNLNELEVRDCKKVKVIFEMNDTERVFQLKKLTLFFLFELTHIWEKNYPGILSFQNLQQVEVSRCYKLKTVFPVALAKNLKKLENLQINSCKKLQEIVGEEEEAAARTTEKFVFPLLTLLQIYDSTGLTYFYPGAFTLECPALDDLFMWNCKLELFQSAHPEGEVEGGRNRHTGLLNPTAISNLKELWLGLKHTLELRSRLGQFPEDLKNLNELNLLFVMDENEETTFPFEILQKASNLESLTIGYCSRPEIFVTQNPEYVEDGMLGHLKTLSLYYVSKMESIGSDYSSWLNTVYYKLRKLLLVNCPDLKTLAHSAVSFSCLKELYISKCAGLEYLFTYSAAEKLKHLEEIIVHQCGSMKEIVLAKEQEETTLEIVHHGETTSQGIKFERLERITLHKLSSLECFYAGNHTLQLPSLIQLSIWRCPKMVIFSQAWSHGELFRGIQASSDSNDELVFHGDLNASVKRVFLQQLQKYFEGTKEMGHSEYLELQQALHDGVALKENWFYSLKTLKLVNCELQRYAIPSHLLPYLNSLNELEVRGCNKVEVIFEKNDTERASQLKILTLEGLLELMHIWEKNCPGILSFQNLQQVRVSGCANLKTLFPVALAKNLKKLKILEIKTCIKLPEIVGEEEEAAAARTAEKFVFPRLTKLQIYGSTRLTHFYPGTFTLECPALNHLYMWNCKLELLQSAHPAAEGESSRNRDTGLLNPRAISNLKYLGLDWKHASKLRSKLGQFPEDFKYLNELYLNLFGMDEKEEPTFPFEILQKTPNLESLSIDYCSRSEIFVTQNPEYVEDGMLRHLKTLFMYNVYEMESIGSDDSSWLITVCDKLRELNVFSCYTLKTLVHSAVSFSCLKELNVRECARLKYLFTSSAAEKLKHLEKITVKQCGSMKEIVLAKEQDETTSKIVHHGETTSERIKFERLEKIFLKDLSRLKCFYSGNDTLQLPSLIQVSIWQCPKMEIFSQALAHGESFRGIQASSDSNDELVFHGDLNASVKRVFLQQDHLVLGDSPMLQEIWCTFDPVPDWCFCNLSSLVVEGCDFISNAILPSHLLPFLSNLKELQVRKCNSVKAIFDDMVDPLSIGLKKLTLEQLPSLKHIWKKDPQGSLSLPFLKEVLVDGCESIKSLFPASVAKDRLQKLDVKNCDGIVEIFAKDEATTEEAYKEFIISPNINSLSLWNLPNLKCIYPGMRILEWPMLKEIDILQCQMLNFFVREFQNFPDLHPEGQDPADKQAIVSLEKVTPHLELLSLTKEEVMMIEQGKLHVDLQRLYSLTLQDFHDKSDAFPFVFRSKVSLPIIEKLRVIDSAFKEIFPSRRPDMDYNKILSQLKGLELQSLSHLESIGLEHSWMDPFLENLETLHVSACNCLTNLTLSIVSFPNLRELNVKDCGGLKYLFTSSTGKTLGVLSKMHVANCKSIENIVAHEDADEDDIVFGQLEILTLSSLPKLGCFYSGGSTLKFPSFKEVSLTECNGMTVFRDHDVLREGLPMTIDGILCHWEA